MSIQRPQQYVTKAELYSSLGTCFLFLSVTWNYMDDIKPGWFPKFVFLTTVGIASGFVVGAIRDRRSRQ